MIRLLFNKVIVRGAPLTAFISCVAYPIALTITVLPSGNRIRKLPSGPALAPAFIPFTLKEAPDRGIPVESTIFPVTSCVCAFVNTENKKQDTANSKNFLITADFD